MKILQIAALCVAVSGLVSARAQKPAPESEPTPHVYRKVGAVSLSAYVFAPRPTAGVANNRSAILFFHGGGWVAGAPDWTFATARRYADLGLVSVSIQYRLSDDKVTPIDALADVCAAFRWVRQQATALRADPQRIAAHGVSAGGHLAAAAATIGCGRDLGTAVRGAYGTGGPDALVLWSPALDVSGDGHFRRLLLGRAPVADYSPVEHIRPKMPPTHIVHGERDTLTPLSGARRFCDRAKAASATCELVVYPGVGHLLTRNLANQESDFDPDPVAREDGQTRQRKFIAALWPPK